ncbi:MAG TPA: M14 family zinc carboxypeptidase [Nitrososphaeraceae archaeon]|jgi:hypothetical protein
MIDVHSFDEGILYPWGDDNDQFSKPDMNFSNSKYDNVRGYPERDKTNYADKPKEKLYKEYILKTDLDWFKTTGKLISRAISGVHGKKYTVKQSVGLYPTSASSDDYSYSRHIIDTSKGKVMVYTLETGKEFQPPIKEGSSIIYEVSAGLMAFCLSLCKVTKNIESTETILRDNSAKKSVMIRKK